MSLKGLARVLFAEYLLPFEIVGLLLLVAVIGATVAARRAGQSGSLEEDVSAGDAGEEPIQPKEVRP